MAAKGKSLKKCGTEFKHKKWAIKPNERIKGRGSIPRNSLKALDKLYKNVQHTADALYCDGCIAYINNHCAECGREKLSVKDAQVQTIRDSKDGECQTRFSDFVDAGAFENFVLREGKAIEGYSELKKRTIDCLI